MDAQHRQGARLGEVERVDEHQISVVLDLGAKAACNHTLVCMSVAAAAAAIHCSLHVRLWTPARKGLEQTARAGTRGTMIWTQATSRPRLIAGSSAWEFLVGN